MSEDTQSSGAEDTAEDGQTETNLPGTETLFYGFPRKALRADDVEAIRDALEAEGYVLCRSDDSDNVLIRRQGEADEDDDPLSVL